jgi:hypothetical protein
MKVDRDRRLLSRHLLTALSGSSKHVVLGFRNRVVCFYNCNALISHRGLTISRMAMKVAANPEQQIAE